MKCIGIIANCDKERAPAVLRRLSVLAASLKLELLADKATAKLLKRCKTLPPDRLCDEAEAIIALGGDGTMLSTVRTLAGRDKPVMGVNLGGLGFMTSVAEEELGRALKCLSSGDFQTSTRAIAEARLFRNGKELAVYRGLNDIVLLSGPPYGRVVTLDVSVENEAVTSYLCDGLIISTPTGSTGHSMSAGGPILTPDTPAFVISLICPHTLSSRPLVVPDSSLISIRGVKSVGDMHLSVDGQVGQLFMAGDCIRVQRSANGVRFIHLPGYSYFSVLRQKLHWRGSAG
ncbi:MAG: NAD(+)/NADH kinase [bacterium]